MMTTTVSDVTIETFQAAVGAGADFHHNLCESLMGPGPDLDALRAEGEAALDMIRDALRSVFDIDMRSALLVSAAMVRETLAEAFSPVS